MTPLDMQWTDAARANDVLRAFESMRAEFEERYGHPWKWTRLELEGKDWYATRFDGQRDYLGSTNRALVALRHYLVSGRDNAAARRAGTPAPEVPSDVDEDKREQRPVTLTSAPRSSAFDDTQARQSSVTRGTLTPVAAHPRTTARLLVHKATCVQCGKPFDARRSDAKTCSPTCRKAYSRRGQELLKAYDEARRAVAEIGARMRQYPDLAEVAAANLREIHDQVGHLLGYYEDMFATG